MKADRLLELVDSAYAAAEAPQLWRTFLERLNVVFRGTHAAIFLQDTTTHAASMMEFIWDSAYMTQYIGHYAAQNPWLMRPEDIRPGSVHTSPMMLEDRDLVRTEFYADFLRPQNLHHMIGACIAQDTTVLGNVTILRPRRAAEFSADEVHALRTLTPHVQRAIQLHRRLSESESERRTSHDALNQLAGAVIVVNGSARILFANKAAGEMLARGDGIRVASNQLSAQNRMDDVVFSELVRTATRGDELQRGGVAALRRASGARDFVATVAPLQVDDKPASSERRAVIFVADPDAELVGDAVIFQRAFHLTAAEAAVAECLVAGKTIDEISDGLAVTINTVKTHLKNIFTKTATSRQGAAVAVLIKALGAARPVQ